MSKVSLLAFLACCFLKKIVIGLDKIGRSVLDSYPPDQKLNSNKHFGALPPHRSILLSNPTAPDPPHTPHTHTPHSTLATSTHTQPCTHPTAPLCHCPTPAPHPTSHRAPPHLAHLARHAPPQPTTHSAPPHRTSHTPPKHPRHTNRSLSIRYIFYFF